MIRNILCFAAAGMLLFSCAERDKTGKVLDTITTGEISVAVEEGYKPVIASCIDVFDSIYRTAKINPRYVSEGEAVKSLIEDSVQVVVIGRQLTAKEIEYFQSRGFKPPTTPIAFDALGVILNPANLDSVLTIQQVKDILAGKITNWSEINPKSKLGK
ncbi:MAG: substrate-binding domain-containing protein, partial [Saprospiraceae bacterium]|nr:substrate-binding domain-containing protein [Saprospiraceae bacterium]